MSGLPIKRLAKEEALPNNSQKIAFFDNLLHNSRD